MKLFAIIFLVFLVGRVSAQSGIYHPFPDSSAIWTEQAQSCCASNCPGLPIVDPVIIDYNFSYFLSGDTTFNGFQYNKMYKSGFAHEHCMFGSSVNNWVYYNNDYVGGLRQDTALRRVYFIDAGAQECLLYDFNLNAGDTVSGNCVIWGSSCAIVVSIDSVFAGSDYRKCFNLSTNPPYSLIEGIGSTSGLMEPLCPFEYFGSLICFTQEGTTLYPDALTACEIVSVVEESADRYLIKAFPNPVQSSVTIEVDPGLGRATWTLYNGLGKKVRNGLVQSTAFEIHRLSLPSGMYLIQLVGDTGKTISQKLILE